MERKKRLQAKRAALRSSLKKKSPTFLESSAFEHVGFAFEDLLIDDSSSAMFGGIKSREYREKLRIKRAEAFKKLRPTNTQSCGPSATAGENLASGNALINIVQPPLSLGKRLKKQIYNSVFYRHINQLRKTYDESNNVFVFVLRSLIEGMRERFGGWFFNESETAQVILHFRQLDPSFTLDGFLRECRELIIPEVLEAFLNGELLKLKQWVSEPTWNVLKANFDAMSRPGCRLEGELFDLRNVELAASKMLDEERPVLVISFQTQQIMLLRDVKSGEIVDGDEEKLERYSYVWAITKEKKTEKDKDMEGKDHRSADIFDADSTGGWKIVEIAIRQM